MQGPAVGKGFRGEEGHIGYLLQQAAITFRAAADSRLRDFGLSLSLYSVITVLTASLEQVRPTWPGCVSRARNR